MRRNEPSQPDPPDFMQPEVPDLAQTFPLQRQRQYLPVRYRPRRRRRRRRYVAVKLVTLFVSSIAAGAAFGPGAGAALWGVIIIFLTHEATRRD